MDDEVGGDGAADAVEVDVGGGAKSGTGARLLLPLLLPVLRPALLPTLDDECVDPVRLLAGDGDGDTDDEADDEDGAGDFCDFG